MDLDSWVVLGGVALILFGLVVLLDYRGINAWYVRKVTRWETTDPKIVRFGGAASLLFAGVSLLWNDLFPLLGGLLILGARVAILTDPRGYGHQIVRAVIRHGGTRRAPYPRIPTNLGPSGGAS